MANLPQRPDTHGPRNPLLNDGKLFEKTVSKYQLHSAWSKVWNNQGASGGDNVTVHRFASDIVRRLSGLRHSLKEGTYRPGPVRSVSIPKRSGRGVRTLVIPCVVDRVVQTSAAMILTPLLDQEFEPASFGYRPNRSVNQAVQQISLAQKQGFNWVVDADIENYFDSIAHERLMERWGQSVTDGPLTELVWSWLTHACPDGRGVPQGSPISPLLANLYLDRLDEEFYRRDMRFIRFADDFVILCRSRAGAEGAMDRVVGVLGEFGLNLNREKSRIVDFARGFKFLGHLFVQSMTMKVSPEKADDFDFEQALREIEKADAVIAADAALVAAEEKRKLAYGFSPGFKTLHIKSRGRRLNIRNQAFCVEEGYGKAGDDLEWGELIAIPHQQIERIDIGPGVSATNEALRHALATDTVVAYVNGHGETQGWVSDTLAPRAARHLEQARTFLNESSRLDLARIIVEARLRNQRAVLRRLLAGRKGKPEPVLAALVALNRVIGRGETSRIRHAKSVEKLMGYEGAATAHWWRAIAALVHPDFKFLKRKRERNSDPANICLNFLAWLLNRDISIAVMQAGLHPGFGALHAVSDQRDACVYDLMEEFRAHMIGGLLVYATNKRLVRPEMFSGSGKGRRMRSSGGDSLIRAYESRANGKVKSPRSGKRVTWRRLMVEQAFALAAHVEERKTYSPYIMDY